ncbi:hypothetical protein TVAG_103300 [Trichomonas vaginalis G3]|uniref:Vacuolar import/degradation Vid27 C-terminal domain-containing protein n=1 Tax=Trichomonas vaginalis (strain ATCC PRA-98 / G3) TaxID=412133 RepID=A2EKP1_TRIV3|nr:VID27 cytoplasmic protein family [Trichomonas vaginalis G3]EAY06780.1 hypothetical protein TVAG_103300 [Trichomonas vaginalis G3]KAI5485859.1 VID27 cytoplasmic protein family [Trichomonas vaginalis G3]|eukprot:XP_001319003.1 hypothetical protein [Trichomonas vaginalis G3]
MSYNTVISSKVHVFQFIEGNVKDHGSEFEIKIFQNKNFDGRFQLVQSYSQEIVLEAAIRDILNVQYISAEQKAFFDVRFNNKIHNFAIVFSNDRDLRAFVQAYTKVSFENNERRPVDESDAEDILRFMSYLSLDDQKPTGEEHNARPVEYTTTGRSDTGKNIILQSSERRGDALVLRKYDSKCSVGMFDINDNCKFMQAIPTLQTDIGTTLLAKDMLRFNDEKSLYLLDDNNEKTIYNLDLNRGDVISHFDTSYNGAPQTVLKIMPASDGNDESTFLGFNSRNTLRFDPRIEQLAEKSDYKSDNKFTAGKASCSGKLAMGSANGILRLYSAPCKNRATTQFQVNVGDQPITCIDISIDEEWVVTASPYYISLVNTFIPSSGKLAFNAAMGREKPPCMRLIINPEHQQILAKYHGGDIPVFSSVKFESRGAKPIAIVATIGTAIVSWDFKRIIEGKRPTYSISLIGGEVLVDNKPIEKTRDILFMSENQINFVNMHK